MANPRAVIDAAPHPQRIRAVGYRVLAGIGDARAALGLSDAHAAMIDDAGRVNDPAARDRFAAVAQHREIAAAWARRIADDPAAAPGSAAQRPPAGLGASVSR